MDLEKLGDYRSGHFNQKRLGTVEAVEIYLKNTAEKPNTQSAIQRRKDIEHALQPI